jgi:putative SbcD/Mre11-related phosphoesterase
MFVEPVLDAPAATAPYDGERALLIADYHAGIEAGLRYERGVELRSNADRRRERVCSLLEETGATRLVVIGDLGHQIGAARDAEFEEIAALLDTLTVPLTLVQGNHDGDAAATYDERIDLHSPGGTTIGPLGLVHGHTWPDASVLEATVVCMGHEHPAVRLQDPVGGTRVEQAWLRGHLDGETVISGGDLDFDAGPLPSGPDLVVFPAFNERSGGTWINVAGQSFLSPYLPEALGDGEAYLLDGTRLGDYQQV